jgi:hypothetical protein
MSKKITTKELAGEVELSDIRIRQMILRGDIKAEKFGRDYMIDAEYIEIIRNRPERRGRKHKKAA